MATTTRQASFSPELFSFLSDLRANNDREWFAANKHRYEEHVLEPALAFIDAFAPKLEKISPHFRADARPSGGSLFRPKKSFRFRSSANGCSASAHDGTRLSESPPSESRFAKAARA